MLLELLVCEIFFLVLFIGDDLFCLFSILFVLIIELNDGNMVLWKLSLFVKRILWFCFNELLSFGLVYRRFVLLFEFRILLICLKVLCGRKCLFNIFILVGFWVSLCIWLLVNIGLIDGVMFCSLMCGLVDMLYID